MDIRLLKTTSLLLAWIAGAFVNPGLLSAAGETMTLRINDTLAEPGSRVAVVLRTYAPRGVGQGQICLVALEDQFFGGNPPWVALEEVVVFSEFDDAKVAFTFDGPTQEALIEFESLSASINWSDGPLAVLFFRLSSNLAPGQEVALQLNLGDSFLIDAEGQPIPIEPRGGVLTVRDPSWSHQLAAEGDDVMPGEVAALGVETSALFPISSGQVALLWDPAVAAGSPTVSMDPRHGDATFDVNLAVPGRALVQFLSPDASLNRVPGKFISIDLPIAVDAPPGQNVLRLDPALTHLEGPGGAPIPITLFSDLLEIEYVGSIFFDGFETGDLDGWSEVIP